MKKWVNKQTAVAFVLGLSIALSIPVSAAVKSIKDAEFNTATQISVNGQAIPLELVAVTLDGDKNGSNYAPVKALAEAMGGIVAYDDKTKMISINTETTTKDAVKIEYDKTTGLPIGAKYIDYKGCKAVSYNGAIYLSESDLQVKFALFYQGNGIYKYKGTEVKVTIKSTSRFIANQKVYIDKSLFPSIITD